MFSACLRANLSLFSDLRFPWKATIFDAVELVLSLTADFHQLGQLTGTIYSLVFPLLFIRQLPPHPLRV